MRLSSLDLPLPDGPMIATASPAATARLTSATAGAAPWSYRFVTPSSRISPGAPPRTFRRLTGPS
jgi:hypothetical protein